MLPPHCTERHPLTLAIALALGLSLLAFQAGSAQSAPQLTWGPGGAGGSGVWSTDSSNVDWFNGTTNVRWIDGDTALFSGTAGTVSILGSVTTPRVIFATPGYTIQNFFLNGAASGLTVQTDADATISSSVFGASSASPFTKTGNGVLTFTDQGPVFFGSATITAGEVRFTGSGSPNFTTPYVLANAPGVALTFASVNNTVASLGGGGVNSIVRPNVTSGNLNLAIYGSADASFGGTIQDNGAATLALQKNGLSSTQTLTGVNTYSGATTVSSGTLSLAGANGALTNTASLTISTGGTLLLDNSGAASDYRLANGLAVNLRGGTFSLTGNATASSKALVGAVNFSSASNVSVTQPGTPAAVLTFSSLTRQNNGTLNLSGGGNITLGGVTNLNGIVGGYATVGADWATVDASGRVFAYNGYVSGFSSSTDQNNVRVTSAGATTAVSGSQIHNSLNLVNTGSSAAVLDLGAGQKFDISSGGLLTSGGAGHLIQNGTLTSSGGELVVTNLSALTVGSAIADNERALTVTKSGAGTLNLTGPNTYTGPTVINQGVVRVTADNNLGAGNAVVFYGGGLQAAASFTSVKSLQSSGGTVDTAGFNVAFNGGNNTGSVLKTGAGTLSLTGVVSTVNLAAGTLRLTNLTGGNATVFLSGGRLEATGNVQRLQSSFSPAEVSPGAIGQAAALTLDNFTVLGSGTVVDFDLGSTAQDSLTVASSFFLSGGPLLFRFGNLGGLRTGTAYTLLNVPNFGNVMATSFGIDPASLAAGYQGTFGVAGNVVSITFTAIPEPGTWVWLGVALVVWGGGRSLRRRTLRGNVVAV